MTKVENRAFSLTTIVVIAVTSILLDGQTAPATNQPASIAVSVALQKDHFPVGQSPFLVLTVENLTNREIAIHDHAVRIHVEGEKGEAPTTLVQRSITRTLRPGEAPLRADEYVTWTIGAEQGSRHKYLLSYFYDLTAPGKYTAYIEVRDPLSQKWLRTNTAKFEVEAPTQ